MDTQREAEHWWRQALADFSFLPAARRAAKYDTCCFLAQQTARKALKAYLFHEGEERIFAHSIFNLCDMAAQYAADFTELKERVKPLDGYYAEGHYSHVRGYVVPAEGYTERDAEQAIDLAEAVVALAWRLMENRPA
jgi:HEPN domain-containing protein